MSCMCNKPCSSCGRCSQMLKTKDIFVSGNNVVLLVPNRVFENFERLMLCICQCFPNLTGNETVVIQSGINSAVRYPLVTPAGTGVSIYQLCRRKPIPVTVSTTLNAFVVNEKCLKVGTDILPRTAAPATTNETVTVSAKGGTK